METRFSELKRTAQAKAEQAADATKRFNAAPPVWFIVALGILIVVAFQLARHLG